VDSAFGNWTFGQQRRGISLGALEEREKSFHLHYDITFSGRFLTVQEAIKRFGPTAEHHQPQLYRRSHPVAGALLTLHERRIETLTRGLALELAPRRYESTHRSQPYRNRSM